MSVESAVGDSGQGARGEAESKEDEEEREVEAIKVGKGGEEGWVDVDGETHGKEKEK